MDTGEMITIATTTKPLGDDTNRLAFQNAIRSWVRIEPRPEILVFSKTHRALIEGEGARVIDDFESHGDMPYFDGFVRRAEAEATGDIIMYITDHLILTYDVSSAVKLVSVKFPGQFVATGRRWDLDYDKELEFGLGWADILRQNTIKRGHYQSVGAKDYLLWRKPLGLEVPRFIMGYPWYDTWMVVAAQRAGIPVVDCSRAIMPIHQNHGFKEGSIGAREETAETKHNAALAEGMDGQGHTIHAPYMLTIFDVVERDSLRRELGNE
jgi:hypothetical protein